MPRVNGRRRLARVRRAGVRTRLSCWRWREERWEAATQAGTGDHSGVNVSSRCQCESAGACVLHVTSFLPCIRSLDGACFDFNATDSRRKGLITVLCTRPRSINTSVRLNPSFSSPEQKKKNRVRRARRRYSHAGRRRPAGEGEACGASSPRASARLATPHSRIARFLRRPPERGVFQGRGHPSTERREVRADASTDGSRASEASEAMDRRGRLPDARQSPQISVSRSPCSKPSSSSYATHVVGQSPMVEILPAQSDGHGTSKWHATIAIELDAVSDRASSPPNEAQQREMKRANRASEWARKWRDCFRSGRRGQRSLVTHTKPPQLCVSMSLSD